MKCDKIRFSIHEVENKKKKAMLSTSGIKRKEPLVCVGIMLLSVRERGRLGASEWCYLL